MTPTTTQLSQRSVSCIIPTFNEEQTLGGVIDAVKHVKHINEIIVVDDGSSDQSVSIGRKHGAKVVVHPRNRGKGAAIQTGANHAKNNYIMLVDADIENPSAAKLRRLAAPLVCGEADFVKGSYKYSGGRVTKLVVKPLLKIVYPFLNLEHPLSGEVAFNKRKFRLDTLENNWGIDIQLVLQAARRKLRIKEVMMGNKQHKHQDLDALSNMSEQILRTILGELNLIAHKHKLLFFDLDKTLIEESSIRILANAWGFTDEAEELFGKQEQGEIPDKEITKALAKHFKGKSPQEIGEICADMHPSKHTAPLIEQLRQQRYRIRIVSSAFSPIVSYFCDTLNIYEYVCPRISKNEDGTYTGKLKPSRFEDKNCSCCGMYVCKQKAVDYVRKRFGFSSEECVSIGDGKNDRCMFEACGLSLGYHTDIASRRIDNFSEVLIHVQ